MEGANKIFWKRPTFLVITGASRGIGKNLAIEFSRLVDSNSTLLLMARSLTNLEETKKKIIDINPKLDVKVVSVDLSRPDKREYLEILTSATAGRKYELYFVVHNAGYANPDFPAAKLDDLSVLENDFALNLHSVIILTSVFLNLFGEGERCILNISSLAGIRPFKGISLYCVGKASRDMYFRTLAEENPSLNVLNYAPGPIETDMFLDIAKNCWDPDTRTGLHARGLVKMEDTIRKVIEILTKRCFKNGDHIDFFDPLPA